MKFLANENVPVAGIHYLRAAEHDVSSVIQDSPGATDEAILAQAHAEQRIILTFDCDYGELICRHRLPPPLGIVHFRFAPRTPEELAERRQSWLKKATLRSKDNSPLLNEGGYTSGHSHTIRQEV